MGIFDHIWASEASSVKRDKMTNLIGLMLTVLALLALLAHLAHLGTPWHLRAHDDFAGFSTFFDIFQPFPQKVEIVKLL